MPKTKLDLTPDQIRDIESKKNNSYWWAIYGTGERTKPVGVIFENWEIGNFVKLQILINRLD